MIDFSIRNGNGSHLLSPFIMKAFPECWVSSFFITLYSSWFSFNTNGIMRSRDTVHQRWTINWTYHAHFFIGDISQVGDILEHRNVATNPAVGTNPALS